MDTQNILIIGFGILISILGWSLNRAVALATAALERLAKTVMDIDKKICAAEAHMHHVNLNLLDISKEIEKISTLENKNSVIEYRLNEVEQSHKALSLKHSELEHHVYVTPSVRG